MITSFILPAASATTPYLIDIKPGVYNIGSSSLQMKPYVDIQGSGENLTIIIGDVSSGSGGSHPYIIADSGVVIAASNAVLKSLTVENISIGTHAAAIYIHNKTSFTMSETTVIAQHYGIYGDASSDIKLDHVTYIVSSTSGYKYGAYFRASATTIKYSDIIAGNTNGYGLLLLGGCEAEINFSSIYGSLKAIQQKECCCYFYISNSKLVGGTETTGANRRCIGCYDGHYNMLNEFCGN